MYGPDPGQEAVPIAMKNSLSSFLAAIFILGAPVVHAGGVAVLDIDAVARALGVEEQVRVKLEKLEANLNTELKNAQAQLQSQMEGVEQAAGENPSEDEIRQIRATGQQLNSEFNRLRGQAKQALDQERVRLINEFRIKLEPIAKEAAAEKGLDVVLMKVTPPVFAFATEADVTEDTIRLAIEAGMKVENSAPASDESDDSSEEADGE